MDIMYNSSHQFTLNYLQFKSFLKKAFRSLNRIKIAQEYIDDILGLIQMIEKNLSTSIRLLQQK